MDDNANENGDRSKVPTELREILLDFTISYLLEQPSDIVDYGIEYFDKLKKNKWFNITQPSNIICSDDDDASTIESMPSRYYGLYSRRKPIFAESYDPEEDKEEESPNVVFYKSDAQRQALADIIKHIFLFRALDQGQINNVIDAMFIRRVRAEETIIRQGDGGDYFYVIDGGVFEAYVTDSDSNDRLVHTYENTGSFGELALLYNMPRSATIKAKTDGLLWILDRQIFKRIVMKSAFKKRKMYEELIEVVPVLQSLQLYERMNLADALVPRYYEDNDCIINQGDQGDGMYFVEEGVVRVFAIDESGKQIKIKEIEKGGYFGELALVTHKSRAASVFAVGKVKLAFLDVDAFERLLGPCMDIMKRNIADYENQLLTIFESEQNLTDV